MCYRNIPISFGVFIRADKNNSFSIHIFKWKDLKENFCLLLINTSHCSRKNLRWFSKEYNARGLKIVSVGIPFSLVLYQFLPLPWILGGFLLMTAVLSCSCEKAFPWRWNPHIASSPEFLEALFLLEIYWNGIWCAPPLLSAQLSFTLLYTLSSQPLYFILIDHKAFVNVIHSLVKTDWQLWKEKQFWHLKQGRLSSRLLQ